LAIAGAVFFAYAIRLSFKLLHPAGVAAVLAIAFLLYRYHEVVYRKLTEWTIAASNGWRRWAGVLLTVALYLICPYFGWRLQAGDLKPAPALLFPHHPPNL